MFDNVIPLPISTRKEEITVLCKVAVEANLYARLANEAQDRRVPIEVYIGQQLRDLTEN